MSLIQDNQKDRPSLFEEKDTVFLYGLGEFEATIVSKKRYSDEWIYIVEMNDTKEHILKSELVIKSDIL